uniref:Putative secreted protein n=1 Tax=Ixodes scapularis TaxID=6945 RepID=A0A4D5RFR3_IXOSC
MGRVVLFATGIRVTSAELLCGFSFATVGGRTWFPVRPTACPSFSIYSSVHREQTSERRGGPAAVTVVVTVSSRQCHGTPELV